MVLDMAERGRNQPDDVIVLKCPVCRNTEPLDNSDINTFPLNKKILQEVSSGHCTPEDDAIGDDDLVEQFKQVSMNTTSKFNPDQTSPMIPYSAEHGMDYDRELSRRSTVQQNMPRGYQNIPQMYADWSGFQGYSAHECFIDPTEGEFEDGSYINDVIRELQVTSTDVQNKNEVSEELPDDEDDVMAAIRRSCDEMYGGPVVSENKDDIMTDGPMTGVNIDPAGGHVPFFTNPNFQSDSNPDPVKEPWTDWIATPGPIGATGDEPYCGRNRRHRERFHRFQRQIQRNGFPDAFYGRKPHQNQWEADGRKENGKTEEEIMLKQLQIEADKNPLAADVLEEIMKVKSMKEMEETERGNDERSPDPSTLGACAIRPDDTNSDIIENLKKQVSTNPTAAKLVKEMEIVEKFKDEGHLMDQVLQESANVFVDSRFTSNNGTRNTKEELITDLMGAAKNNYEAAILLNDILNKDPKRDDIMTHKSAKGTKIEEPNALIEEILKDREASSDEKKKVINDIAAKASAISEVDDTFSLLMTEAKENPLAAQILHEMLFGYSQDVQQ